MSEELENDPPMVPEMISQMAQVRGPPNGTTYYLLRMQDFLFWHNTRKPVYDGFVHSPLIQIELFFSWDLQIDSNNFVHCGLATNMVYMKTENWVNCFESNTVVLFCVCNHDVVVVYEKLSLQPYLSRRGSRKRRGWPKTFSASR